MASIKQKLLKIIQTRRVAEKLRLTARRSVILSLSTVLVLSAVVTPVLLEKIVEQRYKLAKHQLDLIGEVNPMLANKLSYDAQEAMYTFNADAKPVDENITPDQMSPEKLKAIAGSDEAQSKQYSLDIHKKGKDGVTIYDSNLKLSFTMKPQFDIGIGRQVDGRLVYPMRDATAVYTTKGNGLKEDILFEQAPVGGSVSYAYNMELAKELEVRLTDDGSIGIYSADPILFGNVSYGNDTDKEKMQNARETAEKNHLVFAIPAPIIVTASGELGKSKAWFELRGTTLYVNARDLDSIHEPFSLDPTVVVTSTTDFKNGNNEGDTSFGTDQINRGQITGGSTGAYATTNTYNIARESEATTVYNGYVYLTGGSDGTTSENTCSGGVSSTLCNDVQYAPINANGTLGTWNSTTSFTTPRQNHTAIAYSGYLYIIGGGSDVQYAPINANGTIGSWTATTSLPASRNDHSSVAYNGYLYVIGGITSSLQNDVQYAPINANGTLGTWNSTTSFTTARFRHTSVVYNNYLYVIGGFDNSVMYNDVQYAPINANGTIGSWTATTSFTTPRQNHTSVVVGGHLYVIGGLASGSTWLSDVQYAPINANGTIGSWTATTSLSSTRYSHTSVTYNGYIYTTNGSRSTSEVIYSRIDSTGTISSYTNTTSIPTAVCGLDLTRAGRYSHASVAYKGYVYITGGNNGCFLNDVHVAPLNSNGSVGSWSNANGLGSSFTTARYNHTSIAHNGYLYIIGGGSTAGVYYNDVQYAPINANGTLGTWNSTTSFPTARMSHESVAYNGYIYVIGGYNGAFRNDVQYAPINANGTLGTWNSTTSFTTARDDHQSVVYGGYMYVIGGDNSGKLNDVQYAPINANGTIGSWTATTSFTTARSGHQSVVHNGYMYVLGGFGSTYLNDVQYAPINANGTIGSWTATTSFTTARTSYTSVAQHGFVYIIAGFNGSNIDNVQYARINSGGAGSSGAYGATTSFATARSEHTSVAYNGYLYVLGGYSGLFHNDVQYAPINANGTLGTWNSTTSFTTARYGHTSVAYNGYLYVIGGTSGSSLNDVQYAPINANGTIGSWTATTSFTTARFSHATVAYNGYLYILGGVAGSRLNDVQYAPINANGTLGTWNSTTSFTTARDRHGSVAVNGYMFVVAGSTGSTGLSDVQYAPINANGTIGTWNTTTSLEVGRRFHTTVAYNGYLYVIGGRIPTGLVNDVQYAPINSNGTIGSWTATTSFTTAREGHTSVGYKGRLYIIGGYSTSSLNDVQHAALNSMPRKARYSKLVNLGTTANVSNITSNGTLPEGKPDISFKVAGTDGVFVSEGNAFELNGGCSAHTGRYVLVTIILDDAYLAKYPDSSYSGSVQDFTVTYTASGAGVPVNARLQRGKYFLNQALQPLDTQKLTGSGGC